MPQIDRLNLEGYANLEHWVSELDKRIEGILLQRLTHIIQVWCSEFDRTDDDGRRDALLSRDLAKRRVGKGGREEKVRHPRSESDVGGADVWCGISQFVEGNITIKPIVHEIRIQNQVIFLDPPIEFARSTWVKQLHDWLGAYLRHFLGLASSRGADSRGQVLYADCVVSKAPGTKLDCKCSATLHPRRPTRHLYVLLLGNESSVHDDQIACSSPIFPTTPSNGHLP